MNDLWGIFADDGCLDSGFGIRAEAEDVLAANYAEDGAWVAQECAEHREHEHGSCELCDAEDAEDAEDE